MPQMSPLQWELLFFVSLLFVTMVLVKIFFVSGTQTIMSNFKSLPCLKAMKEFHWSW